MLRSTLIRAADSAWLERRITGFPPTRDLARRFVAGETLDDGLEVVRTLARAGRFATLDLLGEAVLDARAAKAAAQGYLDALEQIGQEALPSGISVKPTAMGLAFDPGLCRSLLDELATVSGAVGVHLTLDMEGSDVTEATVALVEELHESGHDHVGCAVQSYLHRTPDDVARLSRIGASVRLCKGAYAEDASVAHTDKADVDAAYARLADELLETGTYPRIATHDDVLIDHVKTSATRQGLGRDAFEFQMLYGIRPSLQESLVRDGWNLCVYVPYGDAWFQYFMRRLGERPANLVFFLRSLRDT